MKKILSSFFVLILLAICFAGCSSSLSKEEIIEYIGTNNYPIETCRVTYSIDVTNLKEVVGDSDYVIVAEVKDYISTTYSSTDFPITHYSIKVIENIKGSLDTSCEIELIKEGGLSEKNDKFITYENDFLPQIGQTYIFCLYGQSSGGIRACGEGSVIKFENILDYKNSQTYLDILDAYDNEIVSNRTRYQSKYEVG